MKNKTFLLAVLLSLGWMFISTGHASASPANVQPEGPDIYYTVSAGTTNGTGSNLLYSPEVWIRVYGASNAGGTINFIHGNHCNAPGAGWDSSTFRQTVFELHGANPDGSIRIFDLKSSATNANQPTVGGAGCGTVTLNIPPGALTQSNDPSHISPFNTRLYTGIIKVYMNPVTSTFDGPLNVFKVDGNGYWTGSIATAGWGISSTQTFLGRPSSTAKNTYNLPFKPPCYTFSDSVTSINATLSWFDDDDGTSYQPAFTMRLYEFDEGPGLLGATSSLIYERSGEGAGASTTVTLRRGKKYIWQWEGITNKNGVQVYYPYESADFYFTCQEEAKTFDITLKGQATLNDDEDPTSVKYSNVGASSSRKANNIKLSRKYVIKRSGNPDIDILPVASPDSVTDTIGTSDYYMAPNPDNRSLSGLKVGDQICVLVTASPGSGKVKKDGTITENGDDKTEPFCDRFVSKPYVSFYGNDVKVGGGFEASPCVASAQIDTFLNSSGRGSNTQLAAFALGTIKGLATASLRTSTPSPPSGLSFVNFGSYTPPCSTHNYFSDAPTAVSVGSTVDLSTMPTLPNGKARGPAGTTIDKASTSTVTIPNGKHVYLYVSGNVIIKDNIQFDQGWSDRSQIPSVYIVASGNIYIDKDVTRLDGVYVAQGSGTIYTCANGSTPYTTVQIYDNCGKQLVVNGSFISQSVKLLRTFGSLRNASGDTPYGGAGNTCSSATLQPAAKVCAAEVFNFSPSLYLAEAPEPVTGTNTSDREYQYYSLLPPIL